MAETKSSAIPIVCVTNKQPSKPDKYQDRPQTKPCAYPKCVGDGRCDRHYNEPPGRFEERKYCSVRCSNDHKRLQRLKIKQTREASGHKPTNWSEAEKNDDMDLGEFLRITVRKHDKPLKFVIADESR